jgi:hypothetical protein
MPDSSRSAETWSYWRRTCASRALRSRPAAPAWRGRLHPAAPPSRAPWAPCRPRPGPVPGPMTHSVPCGLRRCAVAAQLRGLQMRQRQGQRLEVVHHDQIVEAEFGAHVGCGKVPVAVGQARRGRRRSWRPPRRRLGVAPGSCCPVCRPDSPGRCGTASAGPACCGTDSLRTCSTVRPRRPPSRSGRSCRRCRPPATGRGQGRRATAPTRRSRCRGLVRRNCQVERRARRPDGGQVDG